MIRTLIYGYGNPGRKDDALGILLAETIEKWIGEKDIDGIAVDTNYQLNIEDAATISHYDRVIFADASEEEQINSFTITHVEPSEKEEFSMHFVSPAFILYLCRSIYKKEPQTFLVHIRGYEWELKEGISSVAKKNLEMATDEVKILLLTDRGFVSGACI